MNKKSCFLNDYNQVAHPAITKAIAETLHERHPGYGTDEKTENAKAIIRRLIDDEQAEVHLMTGGTQTNLTAISAFLRPHEAVIAANSAHINIHETGAIEATGHKIITFENTDGKLTPKDIHAAMAQHLDEHTVKPRLVFISQATELGTVYSKSELTELRNVCDEYRLLLYIDGARLGYALTSGNCDFGLPDISRYADAFYIGGTKNGLLFGEALVIVNPMIRDGFRYLIKQRGGLLAKGFLLGIQFETLLQNDLYFELASHANKMAEILRNGIRDLGYAFFVDSPTNQIFPIFSMTIVQELKERFAFEEWGSAGDDLVIRLVTTWSTGVDEINGFLDALREYDHLRLHATAK